MILAGLAPCLVSDARGGNGTCTPDYTPLLEIPKLVDEQGLVNYLPLVHNPELDFDCFRPGLVNLASQASIERTGVADLARWINLYNLFTLQLVGDNFPINSITDLHTGGRIIGFLIKKTAWDKKFIPIEGKQRSLNFIEHEILRKKFDDPRIHFAIVCAAVSCPPLRNEPYVAERLDEQLNEQGRIFLADETKNHFDLTTRTAYLSPIFKWFADDFGDNNAERLRYLSQFAPEHVAGDLHNRADEWSVKHTDYDWSLNRQPR